MTIPRKCRVDLATPPEVALRAAMSAIEAMPPDTRLTAAGQKIIEALDLVGDYVDEQMGDVGLGQAATCGLLVNGGSGGRCVRVRGHDKRCVGDRQRASGDHLLAVLRELADASDAFIPKQSRFTDALAKARAALWHQSDEPDPPGHPGND